MSINVTVSGNPIRINRGKMVTTAYDASKSEFEKRRLMRLEQVRQQSKDIAENLRNKLKKEKSKCLSEIEKDGETKFKNWQTRKLLELQNQYQEALDEIGLGHRSAAQIEEEEASLNELKEINERLAEDRGRTAAELIQIEKNEANLKKAVPVQRKKMTRDFENSRSNAISKGNKQKKIKKSKAYDSDAENRVPYLIGLSDSDSEVERLQVGELKTDKEQQTSNKITKEQQTSVADFQVSTSDKAAQTTVPEDPVVTHLKEARFDNRISERIKRRAKLNPEVDYCDLVEKTQQVKPVLCPCCQCPHHQKQLETEADSLATRENRQKSSSSVNDVIQLEANSRQVEPTSSKIGLKTAYPERINDNVVTQKDDETVERNPEFERNDQLENANEMSSDKTVNKKAKNTIPSKPKITLKSTKDRPVQIAADSAKPAQFYDHPTRYSKSFLPKSSHVEKIDDDEIVVSPNLLSENEIREKMRQRDIEAHMRGQLALEKEKIRREYRELLRKLPALQKQERICEIGMDKEKYHMSRDRLEELEKKRQNRLDNAYEELFVRKKPAVVTLPKRKKDEERQSLNLATWDVDFDPHGVSGKSRTEQLSYLLSNLKTQKNELLKEIESTLSKESTNYVTKDSDGDFKSQSTDYTRVKTKRKRSRDDRVPSPTTSELNREESTIKSSKKGSTLSSTTSVPSPRKKPKLKQSSRRVLILQNNSTQTTPKGELQQSAATSPIPQPPTTSTDICSCKKDALDDLCEIVIKIKEDEKPEVKVNPPFLGSSVKVVTEAASSKTESPKKATSWGEQLTISSSSQSTTSTSYLEPPKSGRSDKQKKVAKKKPKGPESEVSGSMNSSNQSSVNGKLDPRLLTYIKKLLNMSRVSIDNLSVSAVSEASTPSPSIIETPSNNPLLRLRNVMRYFNIDAAELQKQMSYVSNESSKHYNTSESVTVSTTTSDGDKSVFKSCTELDSSKMEQPNNKLQQYADIAASCTQKISNLTAMIEKVRAEKKKMLENSGSAGSSSDKDLTTTSYRDLPDSKDKSSSQEDLDKLINIDYKYAEKLKQLSKEEIQTEKEQLEDQLTDDELLSRLKRLLDNHKDRKEKNCTKTVAEVTEKKIISKTDSEPVSLTSEKKLVEGSKNGKTVGVVSEKTVVSVKPNTKENKDPFPLFLDIPKLPRLEASVEKKKKRPPPSKGLRAISNGVGLAPHELSTIIEADSQLSTKIESPSKSRSSTESVKSSDVPDILTEVPKDVKSRSTTNSSDDVSEMDTMETMLMSIGMEWAIPTLKKTREALAMTSSSNGSKDSGELSLREFLSRIASSSSKSEEGSLLSESQGISLIQVDNRRTSTPIVDQGEKKEQPVFLTDSDLSSVREYSDRAKESEEKFYDLYEGSLSKTS